MTTIGYSDIYLAKYDSSGNYIWANKIGGATAEAKTFAIHKNTLGNIVIAGTFSNYVDFDPSPASAIFFGKYDSLGNFVWINQIGALSQEFAYSIHINQINELYLARTFGDTVDFNPGAHVNNLTLGGAFIAKYLSGSPLGINNFQQFSNDISIYPNPANDNLSIQASEKLMSVKCFNYLGQNIDLKLENNSANISSLSSGVYFLNIICEGGKSAVKKFIKE